MHYVIFASLMLALPACATFSDVNTIESEPSGALVQIPGHGECETPCTVVAKAGFTPQHFRMTPGGGDLNIVLELAAPTQEVDTEQLPEID